MLAAHVWGLKWVSPLLSMASAARRCLKCMFMCMVSMAAPVAVAAGDTARAPSIELVPDPAPWLVLCVAVWGMVDVLLTNPS